MPFDCTLCQGFNKVIPAIELRHLYIGVAYLAGSMSVTAGTLDDAIFRGKGQSFSRSLVENSSGIKYFDDVNLFGYFIYFLAV